MKQGLQRNSFTAGRASLIRRLPPSAKPLYTLQSPGQLPARLQACQLQREAMQPMIQPLQQHRLQARRLCRVCKKRPGQRKPISTVFSLIIALEDCMGLYKGECTTHLGGLCTSFDRCLNKGQHAFELITSVHVCSDCESLMLPKHCRSASQSSLPDLLGKPLSSSTCTQPSLDTFTADCDVLDSALENVNAEHTSSGKEQANEQQDGKKQASTPPSVKEGPKKEATAPERRVEEPALAGGAPAEGADSSAAGQAEARESKLEAEKILESADKPAQKAAKAKAGQGAGSENASKSAEAGAREASARTHSSSESKPEQAAAPREIQTETEVGSERGTAGEDQEVANLPKNGASAPDTDDRSKVGVSESKGEDQKQHSRPQSSEAAAAGSKRSQEAEAEGQGRAAAPVSDEQTAVMERGGSLMEEADQHDPEGIQLVRHMQVSRARAEARDAHTSVPTPGQCVLDQCRVPTRCKGGTTYLNDGMGPICVLCMVSMVGCMILEQMEGVDGY